MAACVANGKKPNDAAVLLQRLLHCNKKNWHTAINPTKRSERFFEKEKMTKTPIIIDTDPGN